MDAESWKQLHGYPIEEAARCGYCLYIGNICDFMVGKTTGAGSECPSCYCAEDSVPCLDDEDKAALLKGRGDD